MEIEVKVECPKCGEMVTTTVDVDMSDNAPDHSWRD